MSMFTNTTAAPLSCVAGITCPLKEGESGSASQVATTLRSERATNFETTQGDKFTVGKVENGYIVFMKGEIVEGKREYSRLQSTGQKDVFEDNQGARWRVERKSEGFSISKVEK